MRRFITIVTISFFSLLSLSAQTTKIDAGFFDQVDGFLKKHVSNDRVDYAAVKKDPTLTSLIEQVSTADVANLEGNTLKAFYINAYNLLVINNATQLYPVKSVQDKGGFFDTQKSLIAGKKLTLNQFEKEYLLNVYKDARLHFVLVCGALGCPPITNFAYKPAQLEMQLKAQTQKALNNASFIQVNKQAREVKVSEIFNWYAKDFGGNKAAILDFINTYRMVDIPTDYKLGYYTYDWALNGKESLQGNTNTSTKGKGNNASRYVVSAAIPKGSSEIKLFNNLYSQQTTAQGDEQGARVDRSTFFTSQLSYLYGVTGRFNLGFDARYRRVRNDKLPSSPFAALGSSEGSVSTRQGLTTLGPKIRWAPFKSLSNFSIQSTLQLPVGKDFEGTNELPFIDWNGITWWTQFFNDFNLGTNFSLFTEVDFLIEDFASENAFNRISTPATVILSYFPNPKSTLYVLSGYSPYWQQNYDYFAQLGVGAKYQITPKFELEFLYTSFTNKSLAQNNGVASTINFGIRVNR